MNPRNPWSHAAIEKRDYITPEDISAAIVAGASKVAIYAATLAAIEMRSAEDYRLCAYVALKGCEWKKRERKRKRTAQTGGDSR